MPANNPPILDYTELINTPTLGTAASHAATDFDTAGAAAAVKIPYTPQVIGVAMRSQHYTSGRSATNQTGTSRYRFGMLAAAHGLRLVYRGDYRGGATAEDAIGNSISVKAAIEYNGVTYPVTFNGARTAVMDSGGCLVSDGLEISVPVGANVWARTYWNAGTGGYVPLLAAVGTGSYAGSDAAVYGSDLTDGAGTTSMTATAGNFSVFAPTALLGVPNAPVSKSCVAMIGDSIVEGSADNPPNDCIGGFVRRALTAAGIPYVDLASGGDTAALFVSNGFHRSNLLRYATHAICNYGTNDLFGSAATVAQLKANLLTIWAWLKSFNLQVYHCTMLPRTSSSDLWSTVANRSLQGAESNRLALNSWLRDASANGAVAQSNGALVGIFETAWLVESAHDSGKWAAAPQYDTGVSVTGAGASYFEDNTKSWPVHTLDYNAVVHITSGTGAGQYREISANSPGYHCNITSPWTTQPDATSHYEILVPPTADGIHPQAAGYITLAGAVNTALLM